jgi:MFS family permease
MSILRLTVIRLHETPKFLIGEGRDEECAQGLQAIAQKYSRPCSLTSEKLQACGIVGSTSDAKSKWRFGEINGHLKGLYATKRIGISTTLIWFSWTLIGLAYPLYNVFLPTYLASRGAEFGETSAYMTWRNYALANFSGIWGPVLAGYMCSTRLGRKYTMVIGALVTMAFFFAYTQVRNQTQNVAFNCVISFCLNVYYGCLYAYTPEVLPSAHRGTGNGIAIGWNRVMGILSAVIATVADVSFPISFVCDIEGGDLEKVLMCSKTNTPVPIYICAALYIVMAGVAAIFPFEPYGKRSS